MSVAGPQSADPHRYVERGAAKPHPLQGRTHAVFVTGTDTGVGKTYVAAGLLRALVREGFRACGMKPVAAGFDAAADNADVIALQAPLPRRRRQDRRALGRHQPVPAELPHTNGLF